MIKDVSSERKYRRAMAVVETMKQQGQLKDGQIMLFHRPDA